MSLKFVRGQKQNATGNIFELNQLKSSCNPPNCFLCFFLTSVAFLFSIVFFPSCLHLLVVFMIFSQTMAHIGSNLSYKQLHPMTQPGSAWALSFIYDGHYQRNAKVMSLLSLHSMYLPNDTISLLPAVAARKFESTAILQTFRVWTPVWKILWQNKHLFVTENIA